MGFSHPAFLFSQEASTVRYKCEPLAFITRQPHYQDIHNCLTEHAFYLAALLAASFPSHTNSSPSARQALFFLRVTWKALQAPARCADGVTPSQWESPLAAQPIAGREEGMMEARSYWRCAKHSELTVLIVCVCFFLAVIAKLCGRWSFVCNKSPTYFGGGGEPPTCKMESRNPAPTLKLPPRNLPVVLR